MNLGDVEEHGSGEGSSEEGRERRRDVHEKSVHRDASR